MKWYIKLSLSVLSGLLFAFAWYPHGFPLISFTAIVPLLWLSDISLKEGKRNAFGRGILLFYPAFFVFNLITTYWIAYCTVPGAAAAVILNALLQTLVMAVWHACRKPIKNHIIQAILLISFWISFEYLHLNWDLTWPWLTFGNVFASTPWLVQWYCITGALGGTAWILIVNFLIYQELVFRKEKKDRPKKVIIGVFAASFILPLLVSLFFYWDGELRMATTPYPIEAVIVQQNTDPWEEE